MYIIDTKYGASAALNGKDLVSTDQLFNFLYATNTVFLGLLLNNNHRPSYSAIFGLHQPASVRKLAFDKDIL